MKIKTKKCSGCEKGLEQIIIDNDGVLVDVSHKFGYVGHAIDDMFMKCTGEQSLTLQEAVENWNKNHKKILFCQFCGEKIK